MLLQGGCASTGVSITYDNEIHLITCVRYKYNQNHNDLDNDNVNVVLLVVVVAGPNLNPHYLISYYII